MIQKAYSWAQVVAQRAPSLRAATVPKFQPAHSSLVVIFRNTQLKLHMHMLPEHGEHINSSMLRFNLANLTPNPQSSWDIGRFLLTEESSRDLFLQGSLMD